MVARGERRWRAGLAGLVAAGVWDRGCMIGDGARGKEGNRAMRPGGDGGGGWDA